MSHELFPPPDTGVHSWLFGRAVHLRKEGVCEVHALAELSRHVSTSHFRPGRTVSPREITDAVTSAYRGISSSTAASAAPDVAQFDPGAGWPEDMPQPNVRLNVDRQTRILTDAGQFGLVDLWQLSPLHHADPGVASPHWVLSSLFAPTDLLCIGRSMCDFHVKPLSKWSNNQLASMELMVPNALRKAVGRTKDGKDSAHCRDTVGTRRYIVVEFDGGLEYDKQAAIIEHLRTTTKGRLAAVVMSGGKSLHAWFRCSNVPSAQLYKWFRYAVTIGADPRLWLPEQFVRLPDGRRQNGKRQSLLYLNPHA